MDTDIIFTVINAAILASTAWVALKRTRAQNVVDDSTASTNFRKIAVDLQAELDDVKAKVEGVTLNLGLSLEIGKAPVVTHYEWVKKKEKKVEPS